MQGRPFKFTNNHWLNTFQLHNRIRFWQRFHVIQRERHSEIMLFFLKKIGKKKTYSEARGNFIQNNHWIYIALFVERLYGSLLV